MSLEREHATTRAVVDRGRLGLRRVGQRRALRHPVLRRLRRPRAHNGTATSNGPGEPGPSWANAVEIRVSEGERDEAGRDRLPDFGDVELDRFEWAWNSLDGEVVWAVSGPGDGLPAHAEHLLTEWGRPPSMAKGDVLGTASRFPIGAPARSRSEREEVVIEAYYGKHVPRSILRRFQEAFPEARLLPTPRRTLHRAAPPSVTSDALPEGRLESPTIALSRKLGERSLLIRLKDLQISMFWAVSSVGRAPARQAGGHWFEPSTAHPQISAWLRPSRGSSPSLVRSSSKAARTIASSRLACSRFSPSYRWR